MVWCESNVSTILHLSFQSTQDGSDEEKGSTSKHSPFCARRSPQSADSAQWCLSMLTNSIRIYAEKGLAKFLAALRAVYLHRHGGTLARIWWGGYGSTRL